MNIQNRIIGYDTKPASWFLANPNNWRIHPKFQQEALKVVLSSVGWVQDVIVNKRMGEEWGDDRYVETLVDGHLRVLIALQEGDDTEVPLKYVDLSPEEEHIILASLDPVGAMAQTDRELVGNLLAQIDSEDSRVVDLIDDLSKRAGINKKKNSDDNDVKENEYEVQRGQVWRVGKHRLMCGDATSPDDIQILMDGAVADMTFTSPPYNLGKSAAIRHTIHDAGKESVYENDDDDRSQPEYLNLLYKSTSLALQYSQFVFYNIQMIANNKIALSEYVYNFREKLADIAIWYKVENESAVRRAPAMASNVMNSQFEFIYIFSHDGKRAIGTKHFRGTAYNVYVGAPNKKNKFAGVHAAGFPVHLPDYFISTFSKHGGIILDNFIGTGTTAVACDGIGRICYGMEIDPTYMSIALSRLRDFCMTEPKLIGG